MKVRIIKKDTLTYATVYAEFQWFLDDFLPEEERVYLKPVAKELQPYDILNPWIDLDGNDLSIRAADNYYSHDAIQQFVDDISHLENTFYMNGQRMSEITVIYG